MYYNKTLGQNFLVNKGVVGKIIQAARLTGAETILEIGPGRGALTFELARTAHKVVAVEKDKALAQALREKLAQENIENVEVITDDILEFLSTPYSLRTTPYTIVANIPYYLTSALIRALLEHEHKPRNIILTIQKEVAQRICAKDGKESILSLSVKFYADPAILFFVSRGSFFPVPNVDSAVIEITPRAEKPKTDPRAFFTLVKAGFSSPRKKLASNLAEKLSLEKPTLEHAFIQTNIDQKARAETLSIDQWLGLTAALRKNLL